MSFKQKVMDYFAVTEQGYKNLMIGTFSCFLTNLSLMMPVMVLFLIVCDALGGSEYDMNLEPWHYIAICAVMIVIMVLAYRFQYSSTFYRTYIESSNVRISMAEKIRRLPLSYFSKKDPTDLSTSMLGDVTMQEQSLTHWFPETMGAMLFTVFMAVGILIWEPVMGVAALWPIPVSFAIIALSRRFHRKYANRKNEKINEITEDIQECLENAKDLKANDATDKHLAKLFGKFRTAEKMMVKAEYVSAVFVNAAVLTLKFGIVTTAIMGGYLLMDGSITVPVFIAFLIMISRLYDPLNSSLMFLTAMISAEFNFSRLNQINNETEQNGTTEFHPDGYDIVFDHVGFSYDGRSDVLKDVSFTAKQGEVTALIGPSGGGKSTVAKLSSRFWDIDKGKITVGGEDISRIDPETLLSCYSIVFQDVTLFNTTVMDNIRIGKRGATDEEVLEAAKLANCDDFVSELPDGYQTVIGENGAKLSGGERQRISIARAILKGAPIILLDEATASLDTECETQVQHALSTLVKGKTVIIVAHRMRTIENADRIVVLKDGVIAEQGSPEELVEQNGIFRKMVALQTDSEAWSL